MTTKKANITIEEYIEMSEVDFNEAVNYEFTSDTCQLANSIYQSLFNPNHSYLSQLDVTYKTPDLMSHFLPPHEVSFTFCCSSIVFPR
ncbi:TPA: hypothetical protein ACQXPT_001572 [Streptococcus pneumoniae]